MRSRLFDPLLAGEDLGLFDDPWSNLESEIRQSFGRSGALADAEPPSDGIVADVFESLEQTPYEEPSLSSNDSVEEIADPMSVGAIAAIAPALDDPQTISASRILDERPDVLRAFYSEYYGPNNDHHSTAWMKRVGGDTPEAYAKYWYSQSGKYEGYSQGPTTAGDNVSLEQILQERPDVLRAFYSEYYGPNNDRHSDAWLNRVGGDTPEAYAKYWYEKYGKWEGYPRRIKPHRKT